MSTGVLTVTATYVATPGGLGGLHEEAHRLGLRLTSELHETGEYVVTLRRIDQYETGDDDRLNTELTEIAEALPGGPVERTARWSLPGATPF